MSDIQGKSFGHWTVITNGAKKGHVFCECSCGTIKEVLKGNLTTGKSTRCRSCSSKETSTKHGYGGQTSGIYSVWKSMKSRCLNSNRKCYKRYGARGITLCDSWMSFEGFFADMSESYQEGLTLERIDNNGDYTPENCVWATKEQQGSNKSNNVRLEYKGRYYTEAELSRLTGVPRTTIQTRRRKGYTGEKLVHGPVRVQKFKQKRATRLLPKTFGEASEIPRVDEGAL